MGTSPRKSLKGQVWQFNLTPADLSPTFTFGSSQSSGGSQKKKGFHLAHTLSQNETQAKQYLTADLIVRCVASPRFDSTARFPLCSIAFSFLNHLTSGGASPPIFTSHRAVCPAFTTRFFIVLRSIHAFTEVEDIFKPCTMAIVI